MPDLHKLSSLSILVVAYTNYTTFPSDLSKFNALQVFIAAGAKLTGEYFCFFVCKHQEN